MRGVALLVVALSGCAWNQVLAWNPHSMQEVATPIAKRAVMIGPGDTEEVSAAGGRPIGTLTMKGDSGLQRLHAAAALETAKRGGTHYFVKSAGESVSTGMYGTVTEVEPRITYGVIRVPSDNWSSLPDGLRPEAR